MNFRSLIDSPTHKNEYPGGPYTNNFPSPPPSPVGLDDFQQDIRYSTTKKVLNKNVASSSSASAVLNSNNNTWFSTFALNNVNVDNVTLSKYHNSGLKPLFPNLTKNLNVQKADPDLSNKKIKLSPSPKKGKIVHCYNCEKQVHSTELEKHLIFGSAKCVDCDRLVAECLDYSSCKLSHYGKDLKCPHNVWEWLDKPVEYLRLELGKSGKTFKKSLSSYIHSLQSLKSVRPYKKAIELCNEYLRFSNVTERSNLETRNMTHPENNSVTEPETNVLTAPVNCKDLKLEPRPKKRKTNLFDIIQLPPDGFYLIERKPREDCPNCYSKLNPKDLSFNLDTWLISVKCRDCYLSIYFVLNPPDGSEHRIKIIT